MRIVVFLNELGFGGTEKAAARWARELKERGHEMYVLTLKDGPRRSEFENTDIEVRIIPPQASVVREQLHALKPDAIHTHAPGHPHSGDVLGEALTSLSKKIPVLQTNIFGQSLNRKEDAWTDFRLYVSWTSCVQAARRSFRRLNASFFRNASVAVYPLDPVSPLPQSEIDTFRAKHGIRKDEVLFGRLSRPEPNKWTDLPIRAFRIAARNDRHVKLLLREPPRQIAQALRQSSDRDRFVILPATIDSVELALTISSLDAVLHTSSIGESFGYGIAEPMNLGKPVIANSTPWGDQAQIELVRHGECGFIASTPETIADKIIVLAQDSQLRLSMGKIAQTHIRRLADPNESTARVEEALQTVVERRHNAQAADDLIKAKAAAEYLDHCQFGHTLKEQLKLRPLHYRVRFHQLLQAMRSKSI